MWWNFILLHYTLLLVLLAFDQAFSQIKFEDSERCRCFSCQYNGNEDKSRHIFNVAFNKPGTSNALLSDYAPACAAVNGDRSNIEKKKPPYNCIHTGAPLNEALNHWIEYDLLDIYTIDTVTLYRRNADGMIKYMYDIVRQRGYDITVDGEVCWSSVGYYDESMNSLHAQFEQKLLCQRPLTGRIVRFGKRQEYHTHNQYQYLVFCEVVIWVCVKGYFGNPASKCNPCPSSNTCKYTRCDNYFGCNILVTWNAAIKKPATQSSVAKGGPQNAVDGGLLADDPGDCTSTDRAQDGQRNSWWQVDLGGLFQISLVKITNRQDCCGERLYNFLVLVTRKMMDFARSFQSKETCHQFAGDFGTGETKSLDCTPGVVGRYVSIVASPPYILQFCEVRPYGYFVEEIMPGGNCGDTSIIKYCAEGTTCIGNKCVIGLGKPCSDNNYLHCIAGSTCDGGICVLALNAPCAGSTVKCRTGAICDHRSKSTCRIALGNYCANSDDCIFGAICDSAIRSCKIPVLSNCSGSLNHCQYRATCDPYSGHLCKWGMGLPCQNTNECINLMVCDYFKKCKTPIGDHCWNSSHCIGGASCQDGRCFCTDSTKNACDPQEGRAGGPCTPPTTVCVSHSTCTNRICTCDTGYEASEELFSCKLAMGSACQTSQQCNTGLVCDRQQCRMKTGNNCVEKTLCENGSYCDGGICKIKPGHNCTTFPNLCGEGTVCIKSVCKLQLQDSCNQNNDYCPEGTMCSKALEDRTPICRLAPGISCAGQKKTLCVNWAVCDEGNVCKVKPGENCAGLYQNYCIYGTECDGGKCRHSLGSDCYHDDECEQGTVCDLFHFQCRLEADRECAAPPPNDMCSSGAICSNVNKCTCHGYGATTRKEGKCEPAEKKIGGICNANQTQLHLICDDPYAHCVPDYYSKAFICQCLPGYEVERTNYTCGAGAGTACVNVNVTVTCVTGLVCDLNGFCSLDVGQTCKAEKRRWCKTGAVCERDMCKANFDQDCSGSNRDKCKSGTECDILSKCKFPLHSSCSSADVCVAGSKCENNICQCDPSITRPIGDICEGGDGVVTGKCKSSSCIDPNARCTAKQKCECNDGFTVHPTDLICKITVGYPCSVSVPLCAAGTTCDETKLLCSLDLGQFCGNGNEEQCVTGGLCDFNKECKLGWNENCNGSVTHLCKSGTTCDFHDRCKIGVALLCDDSSDCVVGATCVGSTCQCLEAQSIQNGYICEPQSKYIGGSCDDINTCIPAGSICTDQICHCDSGFTPSDRDFHCVKSSGQLKDTSTGELPLLLLIAVAAVLCVGIIVALAVRKNTKKQQALQEMATMKAEREKLSRAMQEVYDSAPAADTGHPQKSFATSEPQSSFATSEEPSTAISETSTTAVSEDPSSVMTSDITSDVQSQSEVSVTDFKDEKRKA